VRRIDWKAFGKFDRYFIKEYREATNLKAHILLDTSSSMSYGSDGLSKFDYGATLTAALAYLMLRQQDAVGFITSPTKLENDPSKSAHDYFFALLKELEDETPRVKPGQQRSPGVGRLPEKAGLVILISDLLDEPEEVIRGLKQLRSRGTTSWSFNCSIGMSLSFLLKKRASFVIWNRI